MKPHFTTAFVVLISFVTLSAQPIIQWQKCLGGSATEYANAVEQTNDGGFILAGSSNSQDGDVTGVHGILNNPDYWVVKLNASGALMWQKTMGGSSGETAKSIRQTSDNGFMVIGSGISIDGDVMGCHGIVDYWVVKLSPVTDVQNTLSDEPELRTFPNPTTGNIQVQVDENDALDQLILTDPRGKQILNQPFNNPSRSINLGGLSNGVYFLETLTLKGKLYWSKIIKQ